MDIKEKKRAIAIIIMKKSHLIFMAKMSRFPLNVSYWGAAFATLAQIKQIMATKTDEENEFSYGDREIIAINSVIDKKVNTK